MMKLLGSFICKHLEKLIGQRQYQEAHHVSEMLCKRRPDLLAGFYYKARSLEGLGRKSDALKLCIQTKDSTPYANASDAWKLELDQLTGRLR